VIGNGAAFDATADDDDFGFGRDFIFGHFFNLKFPSLRPPSRNPLNRLRDNGLRIKPAMTMEV